MTSMFRTLVASILLAVVIAFSAGTAAHAAGWANYRELSMRLKEAGRGAEAYDAAAKFTSGSEADMYDREFVCGWIALRSLGRADIALAHFTAMTRHLAGIPSYAQGFAKSKAGYWIGRALKGMGRPGDAAMLFKSSMDFPTTFYGQESAYELRQPIDKSKVGQTNAANYPMKEFLWHDKRASDELVHAVIREESRFNQFAESNKKAKGMMQVMDGTAQHVGRGIGVTVDISMMKKNPDYNVAVGSRYLGELLDQYLGNPMLAVAAYNAGPQRVDEWIGRFGDPRGGKVDPIDFIESIPFTETREYVKKVMGSYITYIALKQK